MDSTKTKYLNVCINRKATIRSDLCKKKRDFGKSQIFQYISSLTRSGHSRYFWRKNKRTHWNFACPEMHTFAFERLTPTVSEALTNIHLICSMHFANMKWIKNRRQTVCAIWFAYINAIFRYDDAGYCWHFFSSFNRLYFFLFFTHNWVQLSGSISKCRNVQFRKAELFTISIGFCLLDFDFRSNENAVLRSGNSLTCSITSPPIEEVFMINE